MVRNISKANWTAFESSLPIFSSKPINSTSALETEAARLIDNVVHAFNIACPLKKAYPGKPCRWWNRNLSNLLRKKNLAARESRKYLGLPRGSRAYLKKVALGKLFRKHMLLAKESTWRDYISELKSPKDISSLLRSLQTKKSYTMPLLQAGDRSSNGYQENLDILRQSHFRDSVTISILIMAQIHTGTPLYPQISTHS